MNFGSSCSEQKFFAFSLFHWSDLSIGYHLFLSTKKNLISGIRFVSDDKCRSIYHVVNTK
ncbi:hypothetical protein DERF_009967 [Dermatophagoides farinae]|uniref:Uncharacterized protein n=1 Tax=Dermatophagoides farinae TaxID=6954 RepID=A0A922HXZ4_DERFA|nr:hypothetical protein DERF_009967 [Dermatophagoides farinae]